MIHCNECFNVMIEEGDGWICDPPSIEHWQFYVCPRCGKSGRTII